MATDFVRVLLSRDGAAGQGITLSRVALRWSPGTNRLWSVAASALA